MDEMSHTEILKQILRTRPGHAFINQEGTALAVLSGPSDDDLLIFEAPLGTNFNSMSEEEINKYMVHAMLSQLPN